MYLKNGDVDCELVQVTNSHTGQAVGLYLVPKGVSIDVVELMLEEADDQDDIDQELADTLNVQRVYAYDSIIDLSF